MYHRKKPSSVHFGKKVVLQAKTTQCGIKAKTAQHAFREGTLVCITLENFFLKQTILFAWVLSEMLVVHLYKKITCFGVSGYSLFLKYVLL